MAFAGSPQQAPRFPAGRAAWPAQSHTAAPPGTPLTARRPRSARFGIRRLLDGRVQLRSRKGEWYTVRLDMEVAGALLLRDPRGNIFAIETDGLPQVDLSDDYVLLMLFSDGSWQDQMQARARAAATAGGPWAAPRPRRCRPGLSELGGRPGAAPCRSLPNATVPSPVRPLPRHPLPSPACSPHPNNRPLSTRTPTSPGAWSS